MKISHFILLVFFTLCLSQNSAFACGGKKSCKKEMSKTQEKDCCGDSCGNHEKGNHNGCNGKCGHSSCVNPIVYTALNIIPTYSIYTNQIVFSTEKASFYYTQSQLSMGYYTIWLIPKISLS
ncbi:hypothetical protein [Flavobacterium magnum]|uniref:hypothetical protein n=1 Tax=Flavobacterium magnum TaxID=2162713 RepID=UPI0011B20426|nr:hypothetical protein [Flavobacterium magnum]